MEAHRLAIEKIDSLLRLEGLKLDVLRRAVDRQREQIQTLNDSRKMHLKMANGRLVPTASGRPLPSLPSEVVAYICNLLYSLGNEREPSTVRRLVDDLKTPNPWRRLLLRDIPVVFWEGGLADWRGDRNKEDIANVVGSDPVLCSLHQLCNTKLPFPGFAITVVVDPERWQALETELPTLCQFPWRNLIISGQSHRDRDMRTKVMNTLVQGYGHKLAGLDRLDVYPVDDGALLQANLPSWHFLDAGESQSFAPKLRSARLHLRLLPGLLHILSAVTDLEVGIPGDDSGLTMSVSDICGFLEPHASTLINLTLMDKARNVPWRRSSTAQLENDNPIRLPFSVANEHGDCIVSFPRLKTLHLKDFMECTAVDVIQTLDCPLLSDITIEITLYEALGNMENARLSASLLHQVHPSLEGISINLPNFSVRRISPYTCHA